MKLDKTNIDCMHVCENPQKNQKNQKSIDVCTTLKKSENPQKYQEKKIMSKIIKIKL